MSRRWSILMLLISMVAVASQAVLTPAPAKAQYDRQLVGKQCSACGKAVPMQSRAGDCCPHCGAYWGSEQEQLVGHVSPPSQNWVPQSNSAPSPGNNAIRLDSPDLGAASPGGNYRAVRGENGYVRVYDSEGYFRLQLPHAAGVQQELFAPDDSAIVCVDQSGSCSVYELPTGILRFRLTTTGTRAAMFAPVDDGQLTIVLCRDTIVFFRSGRTGRFIHGRITTDTSIAEVVLACDGQGQTLTTREMTGRITVWAIATGSRLSPAPGSTWARSGRSEW